MRVDGLRNSGMPEFRGMSLRRSGNPDEPRFSLWFSGYDSIASTRGMKLRAISRAWLALRAISSR
jgi:hypothetical protein